MPRTTTISDGTLTVGLSSAGAQPMGISRDGIECLWQGDARWWPRRAPILFPTVGLLRDGRAMSAEGEVTLGRHGFARDHEFEVASEGPSSVLYRLASSDATRAVYPFDFVLEVGYAVASGALVQRFAVENTGVVPLPFSVGAHPAFNVPCAPAQGEEGAPEFDDYVLRFARPWTIESLPIGADGLYVPGSPVRLAEDADVLPLSHELFDEQLTITLQGVPDDVVTLMPARGGHGVEVRFDGFGFLGVWSAEGHAPFVAIEPWCGRADDADASGVFEEKPGMLVAAPGERVEREIRIRPF